MQTKIFSQLFSKPASKFTYTKYRKSFISSKSKKTLNLSILAKYQLNSLKTITYFSTVPAQKKVSCRQIDDDTNELLSKSVLLAKSAAKIVLLFSRINVYTVNMIHQSKRKTVLYHSRLV